MSISDVESRKPKKSARGPRRRAVYELLERGEVLDVNAIMRRIRVYGPLHDVHLAVGWLVGRGIVVSDRGRVRLCRKVRYYGVQPTNS